ncbi:hypothetical protein PLESTM_000975000 [Pleodorina starrii]|nr:hypothetical protein PLESTM_000975000 [Pleodorina starrii]
MACDVSSLAPGTFLPGLAWLGLACGGGSGGGDGDAGMGGVRAAAACVYTARRGWACTEICSICLVKADTADYIFCTEKVVSDLVLTCARTRAGRARQGRVVRSGAAGMWY